MGLLRLIMAPIRRVANSRLFQLVVVVVTIILFIGSLLIRLRGPELARGRAQDPRDLHGAALLAVLPRRDFD